MSAALLRASSTFASPSMCAGPFSYHDKSQSFIGQYAPLERLLLSASAALVTARAMFILAPQAGLLLPDSSANRLIAAFLRRWTGGAG